MEEDPYEGLPLEVLWEQAHAIPVRNLLVLCSTSSTMNDAICRNDAYWKARINREFGVARSRDIYMRLYRFQEREDEEQRIDEINVKNATTHNPIDAYILVKKGRITLAYSVYRRDSRPGWQTIVDMYIKRGLLESFSDWDTFWRGANSAHYFNFEALDEPEMAYDRVVDAFKFLLETTASTDKLIGAIEEGLVYDNPPLNMAEDAIEQANISDERRDALRQLIVEIRESI